MCVCWFSRKRSTGFQLLVEKIIFVMFKNGVILWMRTRRYFPKRKIALQTRCSCGMAVPYFQCKGYKHVHVSRWLEMVGRHRRWLLQVGQQWTWWFGRRGMCWNVSVGRHLERCRLQRKPRICLQEACRLVVLLKICNGAVLSPHGYNYSRWKRKKRKDSVEHVVSFPMKHWNCKGLLHLVWCSSR